MELARQLKYPEGVAISLGGGASCVAIRPVEAKRHSSGLTDESGCR
jgi:hypothetical protein